MNTGQSGYLLLISERAKDAGLEAERVFLPHQFTICRPVDIINKVQSEHHTSICLHEDDLNSGDIKASDLIGLHGFILTTEISESDRQSLGNMLRLKMDSDVIHTISAIVQKWVEESWTFSHEPTIYEQLGYDLRTPLTEMYVMLNSDTELNRKVLKKNVKELRDVVDDIYWFTRAASNKRVSEATEISVKSALSGFIEKLERWSTSTPVEFLYPDRIDTHSISIYCDERMIHRLFDLLAQNLMQRVEFGIIELEIQTNIVENDNLERLELVITDTGDNWNEAEADSAAAFSPLFSVMRLPVFLKHLSRSIGIGWEMSTGDGLNRLTLTLPLSEDNDHHHTTELGSLTVLVADDNPLDQTWMKKLLEGEVENVLTCNNGWEAEKMLETESVDMVLFDLEMPIMNGFELIEKLDEKEGVQPIMVATTAHLKKEHEIKLAQHGVEHFVIKPLDKVRLTETIRRAISGKDEGEETKMKNATDSEHVGKNGSEVEFSKLLSVQLKKNPNHLLNELRRFMTDPSDADAIDLSELTDLKATFEQYELDEGARLAGSLLKSTEQNEQEEIVNEKRTEFKNYSWNLYKQILNIINQDEVIL